MSKVPDDQLKKIALNSKGQQAQLANNPWFFRGGGITDNQCQK